MIFVLTALQENKSAGQDGSCDKRNEKFNFVKKFRGCRAQGLCAKERNEKLCTTTRQVRRRRCQCMDKGGERPVSVIFFQARHLWPVSSLSRS